jgi:hypothetical protein
MRIFGLGAQHHAVAVDSATGQEVVVEHGPETRAEAAHDRREAERLRRERLKLERREARHRHSAAPLLAVIVLLIAVVGAVWMVLAYREGSFAAGGAVVDSKIAQVTQPARDAAHDAAQRSGEAVQHAGQALEAQGRKIQQTAP